MAEVSGSSVPADNSLIISLHYIYICIKKIYIPTPGKFMVTELPVRGLGLLASVKLGQHFTDLYI